MDDRESDRQAPYNPNRRNSPHEHVIDIGEAHSERRALLEQPQAVHHAWQQATSSTLIERRPFFPASEREPLISTTDYQKLAQRKVPEDTISLLTMASTAGDGGSMVGRRTPVSVAGASETTIPPSSSALDKATPRGGPNEGNEEDRNQTTRSRLCSCWGRRPLSSRTVTLNDNTDEKRRRQMAREFPPNVVRNQKYTVITFVPMILYNQFKYFYNFYFLAICISQLFKELQVNYLFTSVAPLLFVVVVTASKEAYDDYQRYQRDRESNSQKYSRFTPKGLEDVPSSEICVGDIILIRKDQRVPADAILLRTSEKSGSIFLRTDQLDGEIDWKMRLAVSSCQKLPTDESLFEIDAVLYADRPHKDIYAFIGTFTHRTADGGQATEPLNLEHTMWMNTVLASGTALCCVIYTGAETRAVLNTSRPKTKVGITDIEINRLSKALCLVVVAMSLALLTLKGFHGPWWIYLIRFIVLFSSIIPISMRVNMDMGKTVYSNQIMSDQKIPGVIVRTSTLPEELGRVQYLLTDKTGTLTKNDMELKRLHMGTMCYGPESHDELHQHLAVAIPRETGEVEGGGSAAARRQSSMLPHRGRRDQSTRIFETIQALALCHNVTPVEEEDGIVYQASSPDEVAIVKWCELVGMVLIYRDREVIRLRFEDTQLTYDILHVFPFTSETKRMGIIIREGTTGEVLFLEKGADAMMAKIVQQNDWLEEECSNMAREGLRTLVVGRKRLTAEQYQAFDSAYQQARLAISDRNERMQRTIEQMLERDLELLAVTGVEDRLQDDVRGTLEKMRHAGIRIWMLTGDKVETATNIAISTRLFSRDRRILQYQRLRTEQECEMVISTVRRTRDCCLVIDGPSLQMIMERMPKAFMETSLQLEAVVCCRCTPTQKADVARMIQHYSGKRVCCIGDGGNDVSMIQAADIGVGIVGKEGRQASLAADVSVLQFSHLTRLLIWHGRNSYKRTAKLAMFVIHRGFIIAIMQAVFSAIFYFSPIALYQGLIAVGYTTVYTMAPVFSLVLDKDVPEDVALTYVELYRDLTKGRELSYKVFFKWLMISVYQGGVIMMMAIWLFESEFINIVSITFTALILNELLMIALEINTWHYLMGIAEIGSFLIYVASVRLLKDYFDVRFTTSLTFFWKVALITLVSFVPLYMISLGRHILAPTSATKLSV